MLAQTRFWGILLAALFILGCNNQPTDQGESFGNESPDTFFAPLPLDGSMNNDFKLRLEWRGNDRDGSIQGYEYRVDGPFYDNDWHFTESFFNDFKFRNGWYTVEVRAVDNLEASDPSPASLRFHVLGPTFDSGLLLIDNWQEGAATESTADAFLDSLLIGAGYTNYTVWDYAERFPPGTKPEFAAEEGLGAYTSVIWHTNDSGNLGANALLIEDYLDMGGNLWVAGNNPLESLTGQEPSGADMPTSSIAFRYFRIVRANTGNLNLDWMLGATPEFPNVRVNFQITNTPITQYLSVEANQIVALPETSTLFLFNDNYYRDDFRQLEINSEQFAGTPCAIVYDGEVFKTALFGFPLVNVVRAGPQFVNLVNTQAMSTVAAYILDDVFQEPR